MDKTSTKRAPAKTRAQRLNGDTPDGKAVRDLLANGFIAGATAAIIELTNKVARLEAQVADLTKR